jgi:hypothetical protein
MAEKIFITQELLDAEFDAWIINYDSNRNNEDLRFGQHIWNTYDLSNISELLSSRPHDGFYAEIPSHAHAIFTEILK